MIVINNILVSDDLVEKQFICDLSSCKGDCCEIGDAGAPLEDEELEIVKTNYEKIKPFLSPIAITEIEKKGTYQYNNEFGWVTPTLGDDKQICVYGSRDEKGIIQCAFEQAYNSGVTIWKKPISCHLFPVIAKKGMEGNYSRVNYQPKENLCSPGCKLGEKMKVPVYEFLKEALIRKFGEEFYEALDSVAKRNQPPQTPPLDGLKEFNI